MEHHSSVQQGLPVSGETGTPLSFNEGEDIEIGQVVGNIVEGGQNHSQTHFEADNSLELMGEDAAASKAKALQPAAAGPNTTARTTPVTTSVALQPYPDSTEQAETYETLAIIEHAVGSLPWENQETATALTAEQQSGSNDNNSQASDAPFNSSVSGKDPVTTALLDRLMAEDGPERYGFICIAFLNVYPETRIVGWQ